MVIIRIILFVLNLLICSTIFSQCVDYNEFIVHDDFRNIDDNTLDNIIIRTYDIEFTDFDNRHLDTLDQGTIIFLDSIVDILGNNKKIILEIGIHLTIKHSDQISQSFDHMYTEIIDYLVLKGINPNRLSGHNFLDKCPLIKFSDKSNYKSEDMFWEKEWNTNNRVEFKILER